MTTWGADAGQLDALAAAFDRAANVLDQNRVRLNAQVHHAPWKGSSAERFRRDWDSVHLPHLVSAASFLHTGRAALARNAADQRHASATTGPSGQLRGGFAMPLLTTSNRSSVFSAFLATAPFLLHQYKVGKKVIKGGEYAWSVANNLKYRQDVSRLFKVVGTKPDVGFMTVISASIDAAKAGGHLADHQYGAAAWDVWHTTEDVGSAIPVIGWSLTAYKFGNEIGYGLDHQFHVSDHSSDSIQQDAVASLYQGRRTEQLTVAEATQYAHRYDGVSGAGHFAQDFAGSSIKSAKRILGGGW